jgi:hypothetical protein
LKTRAILSFLSGAALATSLALPGLAASTTTIPQSVPNGELIRFVYNVSFPMGCDQAAQMARNLRFKPATDPKTMHAVMASYMACANGPYGKASYAVSNTATYASSAAALLAARQETGSQALRDAHFAKKASGVVLGYRHNNYTVSVYTTNASRINKDATALIAGLTAG